MTVNVIIFFSIGLGQEQSEELYIELVESISKEVGVITETAGSQKEILVEEDHSTGVATITLNRPERYNAFTHGMFLRYPDILEVRAIFILLIYRTLPNTFSIAVQMSARKIKADLQHTGPCGSLNTPFSNTFMSFEKFSNTIKVNFFRMIIFPVFYRH